MELEDLLEDLYNEYTLYHSGSILQFIENKKFKMPGYLLLAVRGFIHESRGVVPLTSSFRYYNLILSEDEKETLISALKYEGDSDDW